jgi:RNA recognition motif-containing protein
MTGVRLFLTACLRTHPWPQGQSRDTAGIPMTRLFVGNLPVSATISSLNALFATHGKVESVEVIIEKETGRPRGFGFVEMSEMDADRAIEQLNGLEFEGRALKVNAAEERPAQGGGRRGNLRRR